MSDSAENQQLRQRIQALEAELKESRSQENHLNLVLDGAEIGIWDWRKEDDVLSYSQDEDFWDYYLGYQPDEAENTFKWWFDNLHPESRREYLSAFKRYISKEADYLELEYRMRTKSGGWVWFWTRGIITAYDQNKAASRMTGVYRNISQLKEAELQLQKAHDELEQRVADRTRQLSTANRYLQEEISRRKQTEKELLHAKQQAEAANKAKSEFLANVSHELRTPMHHILNYSKFGLERTELPKEKRTYYFSQIRISSNRLMNLLNDLLDLSKMESGNAEYKMKEEDVHILIANVASEMSSLIRQKNLTLKIETPSAPTILVCDKDKIEQVFRNLLLNAIEYTPAGREITVRFTRDQAADGQMTGPNLKISIIDQGIGIPDAEKDAIFERFVQSSRTRTGAGGKGLGLAICRKIVKSHQGEIWTDHNPGGGAIFFLRLPYRQTTVPSDGDSSS